MEAGKGIKTHWLYMFNKHHNFRKMISHSQNFQSQNKVTLHTNFVYNST